MSIESNLNTINNTLPAHVKLIAVSKTKPVSEILEAYNAGQRAFGENKIQEMAEKFEQLPKDIEWHMIGHLQRNKVKYMSNFVHLIHGVDSLKTLKEINKQAIKSNRVINCLLQLKIAKEDTKFGLSIKEVEEILISEEFKSLSNVNIQGLMGMASFTDDETIVRAEFKTLKNYFNNLKILSSSNFNPTIISMGMSGDYKIAIEEGSTLVRVGSAIFGTRNYI
ncbi:MULTISPECIES: YggS family pyridoxal phosphate-dependent enzyme [Flavobacteriaceae]|uniref:Pyridoxal phosphate homeostasis protein n=2 Tax=Flavobacteriaceae TaxID=49546 RepID=A0A4Y8AWX8_9FLAO|nr:MULTISPECIES: YggS family pyridoxal phosphate-dependent enzyme [Flavobacteriaceae]TEW76645.1 YggS family pyridoxal phosphate-dependent enzyme [Gramella jeungdoensis]GGK51257.1 YggS family pyridoxal phosphate enzyme [Lutibacter litoralis]